MAAAAALVVIASVSLSSQWLRYPTPGTPRLPDGTPNLSAPAPRTADGRPDLTGVWEVLGDLVMPTDGRIRSKYVYNIGVDLPGGTAPFQPWAREVWNARQKALGVGAPSEKCLPHGIPDAMLTRTLPFKLIQTPGVTIILFEEFNNWRQVFTDGRPLPVDPEPAWLGYSVGRWEKDEFVIESAGFNDKSWLDAGGTPHTEALRTTERLPPPRLRPHGRRVHVRRPEDLHAPVVHHGEVHPARRHRPAGEPVREQQVETEGRQGG